MLGDGATWIGVDSSPAQVAANPYRPVVLADMRALLFREGAFAEVTHLWCLSHVEDRWSPSARQSGCCEPVAVTSRPTGPRDNDPEIMCEILDQKLRSRRVRMVAT